MVSTMVEQFGLVTICPFQPRARCWPGTSFRWSGLISGTSSGTSRSMRWLRELETTTWPAWAKARSISVATEASIAENSSRGALPGLHSSTVRSGDRVRRAAGQVPGHGVPVLLAGGAVARAQPLQVEPRVALQELDEMLAHHAGGAQNAYFDSRLHNCLHHSLIDFDCFESTAAWARALRACAPRGWSPARAGTARPTGRRTPGYRW